MRRFGEAWVKKIIIHTDGGCRGNPGPGGWAAILHHNSTEKEIYGAEQQTTNNRMELTAAIEALKLLKEPCEAEIWTDSSYLATGFMEWMPKWKANGWVRKEKNKRKPLLNADLWQALDQLGQRHSVSFHWLRGHNGHPLNERCDQLVQQAIDELLKTKSQRR